MPLTVTRNRIIIIAIITAAVLLTALFVIFIARSINRAPAIELTVWGVFDSEETFRNITSTYTRTNRNVRIRYEQKKYLLNEAQNYEKELIDALAAGSGPDIFMVQNSWLPKHQGKMLPLDLNLQTGLQFPYVKFRDSFPQVVEQDFVIDTNVYASPLFLDTLAMYYNRDVFDKKGIPIVPSTWNEFERLVTQLREINIGKNEIKTAAAAIGGSRDSINRATDLLNAIMMQRGTQFTDQLKTRATFAAGSSNNNPGLQSLKFYVGFSDPLSSLFTWSERFPYSVDSFAAGDTAIMFNYSHQVPIIKSKNPFLNFAIAPFPQLAGASQPVNYANYWGLAVSNQTKYPDWAWNFILTATSDESIMDTYSKDTGKPPALRTLISKKLNDPNLGTFTRQAFTARSWWQKDNFIIENIFSEMIKSVINKKATPETAIKKAEDEVSLLMRQK